MSRDIVQSVSIASLKDTNINHDRSTICERSIATVRGRSLGATSGRLTYGWQTFDCTLGSGGRRFMKREGDGATPIGLWPMREVLYRADRGRAPRTQLPCRPIRQDDAWCDVVGDRNYNRAVKLPYSVLEERLWRDDHLYDIIVVLGYNDLPRVQGLGSAIFMHGMRSGAKPTAGCVGLQLNALRQLLEKEKPPQWIRITG